MSGGIGMSRGGGVCPGGVKMGVGMYGGGYTMGPGIPPVLTPSGYHQKTYGWQADGTHPTEMFSCSLMFSYLSCQYIVFFFQLYNFGTVL